MSSLAGSPGHGGAGSDPFPAVKRELDEQMQQLAALGAQLCAAAEGAGAAGAAAAAGSFLAVAGHVAQQLDALEAAVAAMVLQPARFRLTLRQAMQRQVRRARACAGTHASACICTAAVLAITCNIAAGGGNAALPAVRPAGDLRPARRRAHAQQRDRPRQQAEQRRQAAQGTAATTTRCRLRSEISSCCSRGRCTGP